MKFQPSIDEKVEAPDTTDPTPSPNLHMPSPEIMGVATLIQLDEEPVIEIAGSRLDTLSQGQGRLGWKTHDKLVL